MSERLERVNVICGGFPCQDISVAGNAAGLAGERSGLWRPMAHTIRMVRPDYAVVENVAALLSRGLGEVLGDLASIGYDAEWGCLSACAFGSTHMRPRLFAVAYPHREHGRSWVWDSPARVFRPLQEIDGFADSRTREKARLANPSELYGGADGLPNGMERNHAIGNAVVPQIAQWIAERIKAVEAKRQ